MLVSQDFTGVRAERAIHQGVHKSKNWRSPTKVACKRTPPRQLASELCHQAVENKPVSPPAPNQEELNSNGLPRNPASSSQSGDGLYIFEKDIRPDYFEYMLEKDRQTLPNVVNIDIQPEISWEMRVTITDFLIQIHAYLKLRPETLHLTINILDRYMSKAMVTKEHFQLVGMSCLWLAAKFEDGHDHVPPTVMLSHLSCYHFDERAFVTMERHILKTIDWELGHPTAESFLQSHLMFTLIDDKRLRSVARFLMEVTLYDACFVSVTSHTIATACLYSARRMLGLPRGLLEESDPRLPCIRALEKSVRLGVSDTLIQKYSIFPHSRASQLVKHWLDTHPYMHFADDVIAAPATGVLSALNSNRPFAPVNNHLEQLETTEMVCVEDVVREEKITQNPHSHPFSVIPSSYATASSKVEVGRLPR